MLDICINHYTKRITYRDLIQAGVTNLRQISLRLSHPAHRPNQTNHSSDLAPLVDNPNPFPL